MAKPSPKARIHPAAERAPGGRRSISTTAADGGQTVP
jgi:hypothetical protein